MRILAIAGSLREESYNRRLLQAAAAALPPNMALHSWDGLAFVPPFNEDLEAALPPPAVADLRCVIEAADAVFVATPDTTARCRGSSRTLWTGLRGPSGPIHSAASR